MTKECSWYRAFCQVDPSAVTAQLCGDRTPPSARTRIGRGFADRKFDLKPHLQDSFKLSTDPFFVEKVVGVVGLYHNPPEKAVVLCVDEKSQSRHWTGPSRCCR